MNTRQSKFIVGTIFSLSIFLLTLIHSGYAQNNNLRIDRSPNNTNTNNDSGVKDWAETVGEIYKELREKTKRSCSAYYELEINGKRTRMGEFSARRGCGKVVPNRCRRRARDSAENCMKAHWALEKQGRKGTPSQCQPVGDLGCKGYNVQDLRKSIKKSACRLAQGRSARVTVYAVTKGDKGCGSRSQKQKRQKLGNIQVNCR